MAGAVTAALSVSASQAAPRGDGVWTETTIGAIGGTVTLHADVLRPANLPAGTKTPVVLSIGPYFNHAATSPTSPESYEATAEGPSERFYDFLNLSKLLQRGYTFVMVDLPGFGGSGGCTDWGGPTEQGATHAAVEWAAAQAWSTGKVALFGKSYDGVTGLLGMATAPRGLAAVVAMEPLYYMSSYLYSDGVRRPNSIGTPALYQGIQSLPGPLIKDPTYTIRSAPNPVCDVPNLLAQQNDNPNSPYWLDRELRRKTAGSRIPLFLTQGFLEANTKPDGLVDFWNGLTGSNNRAWFGQFDHVRGWDREEDGRLKTGRDGFVDEVMRFLELHLKGIKPAVVDPPIVVQDTTGRYRAETKWPPADVKMWWTALRPGAYQDDGLSSGTGGAGGEGAWSISQPLPHRVWMAGEPVVEFDVAGPPRSNLVADLYDVAPDGTATLMSRYAKLLRAGTEKGTMKLLGQDWPLEAGHRLALLLSGSNVDAWTHIPTLGTVTVRSARLGLPALTADRATFLDGVPTARMKDYFEFETIKLAATRIAGATVTFALPPPLTRVSAAGAVAAAPKPAGRPILPATGAGTELPLLGALLLLTAARSLRSTARRAEVRSGAARRRPTE